MAILVIAGDSIKSMIGIELVKNNEKEFKNVVKCM